MLLPDHRIRALAESGRLVIHPWRPDLLQPASIDVTLGDEFVWRGRDDMRLLPTVTVAPWARSNRSVAQWVEHRHAGPLDLLPGQFVLATTREYVALPDDISAQVDGKSTWGRRGLMIHCTAGWVDAGFRGTITLEVANLSQEIIPLTPGDPIGQIKFFRMEAPADRPYGHPSLQSRYQGQLGATPARDKPGATPPEREPAA